MANKNLLKSKAVLKAISIGLAAMMAMTPVVGATDVYADDVDGNEPESNESNISESQSESSENNTQSSENNTQAVEKSYEQAKKALEAGAFALVVGGAITRPAEITARFVAAIEK